MKLTTRGTLAAVMACVGTAVAAAPAVAGTSAPVVVPLEGLEAAVPVESPDLRTGVPVPAPGAPDGPWYVTGTQFPQNTLPAVPVSSELPRTVVAVPVENPLGEGNLGVAEVLAPESDVTLASPGASLGAPMTAPSGDGFGMPELTVPDAALVAPVLQAAPTGTLLFR